MERIATLISEKMTSNIFTDDDACTLKPSTSSVEDPVSSEPETNTTDMVNTDTTADSSKRPRESADDEAGSKQYKRRVFSGLNPFPSFGESDDKRSFIDATFPSFGESDDARSSFIDAAFPSFGKSDEMRSYLIDADNIETTFADVHIDRGTIEALENVTLILQCPAAYKFGILSRCAPSSILLYGPPGNGKTLVVKALAKQARAKILSISGADINDKYLGVGEKKIKSIFAFAAKEHPCIIFIDEADALLGSRAAGHRAGHVEYLNEFLVAMDGIKSRGPRNPIVIAATNRPFDIDEGVLRRLGRRILVDLPDVAGRKQILDIHLRGECLDADVDLAELARATKNYTGSDLKNLVQAAAIAALREELCLVREPASSSDDVASEPTGGQIGSSRVLRKKHFLLAKRQTPPSPISDTVSKIREFHGKHGVMVEKCNGLVNEVKTAVTY